MLVVGSNLQERGLQAAPDVTCIVALADLPLVSRNMLGKVRAKSAHPQPYQPWHSQVQPQGLQTYMT